MTLLELLEKRAISGEQLHLFKPSILEKAKDFLFKPRSAARGAGYATARAGQAGMDLKRFARHAVVKRKAEFRRGQEAVTGVSGKQRRTENVKVQKEISARGDELRAQQAKKKDMWKKIGIGAAGAAGGVGLGALLAHRGKKEEQAYPSVGY